MGSSLAPLLASFVFPEKAAQTLSFFSFGSLPATHEEPLPFDACDGLALRPARTKTLRSDLQHVCYGQPDCSGASPAVRLVRGQLAAGGRIGDVVCLGVWPGLP